MSLNSAEATSSNNKQRPSGNLHLYFTGKNLLIFLDNLDNWINKYTKENDIEITSYHLGVDYNKDNTTKITK